MVASPKATLSTTFAVLRPTPGSASSASRVRGTSPPCSCAIFFDRAMRFFALVRKRPMVLIKPCRRSSPSTAIFSGVSAAANNAGVGRLRREHHRDQQRERIDMLELALGLGAGSLKTAERFLDLGGCPLRQRAGRGRVVGGRTLGRTFDFSRRARAGLAQALRRSPRRLAGGSAGHPARCLASHSSGIVSSMVPDNDPTQEPTIFSAVLTPHRSLSRKGFFALMLV